MAQPPAISPPDHLAVDCQLKIHLLGSSLQTSRRVPVRGDTTLAELHYIFQVVTG